MSEVFIEVPESKKNNGWTRCVFAEDEIERTGIEISSQILNHFNNLDITVFSPSKKEIQVCKFLSVCEFKDDGRTYILPYLWKNEFLTVRQGASCDMEGILSLLDAANKEAQGAYAPSYLKTATSKGLMIVVTDYRNEIKGFKTLSTRRTNKLGGRELTYIKDDSRKKGAFRIIWELAFDAARYANFDAVLTQCAEENSVAEKYRHIGFKEKGRKEVQYKHKGETLTRTAIMFEYNTSKQRSFF